MAFESVHVQSTRNGVSLIVGEREDLVAADVIGLSLTSTTGITSVRWSIIGRPEASAAGGAGPEPILLATAPTSSFTVDADALPVHLDGSYIVEAILNPGSPGEVRKTVLLARMAGITIPKLGGGVRSLRKLGGFESLEDTSIPTILQGWKTQLNRWLDLVQAIAVGGGVTVTMAGAYGTGTTSTDQTLALTDARGGGLIIDGSSGSFTGATAALRVNTAAGGPLVVDRATGNLGVGTATPAEEIHVRSASPGLRLDSSAGGGQAFAIENQGTTLAVINRTSAATLYTVPSTGGIQANLGVGIGAAPATAAALSLGTGSTVAVSTAHTARIRYNEVTELLEFSQNTGNYIPFANGILLTFDGTTTGSSQLVGFNTTSTLDLQRAWVKSRRMLVYLDKTSTLTPDGIDIFPATAGVWKRIYAVDHTWTRQTFWAVDPVSGNDDNAGCGVNQAAADAVPLKTLKEANIRMFGSALETQVFWHILNHIPLSDTTIMDNVRARNANGYPTIYGAKIPLGTWHIGGGGYSTAVPSANTGYLITATPTGGTTIGIGDASLLGKLLETSNSSTAAFIQDNPAGNQVRVSAPDLTQGLDPNLPGLGVNADFAAGQDLVAYDLIQVPVYPFAASLAGVFSVGMWCRFGRAYQNNFTFPSFAGHAPFICRSIVEGGFWVDAGSGDMNCVLFTQDPDRHFESVLSGGSWLISHCALRGPAVINGNCTLALENGCVGVINQGAGDLRDSCIDFQHGRLNIESSKLEGGIGGFSAFNCTAENIIHIFSDSWFGSQRGPTYGQGNTQPFLTQQQGSTSQVPFTGLTIATGSASFAVVAGRNVTIAEVAAGYADGKTLTALMNGDNS